MFPHRSPVTAAATLRAAGGQPIQSWGTRTLPLSFSSSSGGTHRFDWEFTLAAVDRPILGADFLRHHQFDVSIARHLLVSVDGEVQLPLLPYSSSSTLLSKVSVSYQEVLAEFPEIVGLGFAPGPTKHDVRHHVETKGPPISTPARRLDPQKYAAAKAEFERMEKAGIVRRSNSPWASALHMVPKPDGSWRPCGDFRRLNNATVPDKYPVPNIRDFTNNVAGSHVFSTLDLVKGYYQVEMFPDDIPKTAIITPFGLFEFVRMPFGLRNAGSTFQRLMDRVLVGLPFIFVYLDDVLIASPDHASHRQHLREVFGRLRENGLTINPKKSVFGQEEVKFLGHRVSASGIRPLPGHVEAVVQFPRPSTRPDLQRFLGLVNFYRRFLRGAAGFLLPLTNALQGPGKSLDWSPSMEQAFNAAKTSLANAAELEHPQADFPISLMVDASGSHVGAVLQHFRRSSWAPLSFYSKKLTPAETRYSAFDRELLAVYSAIRHFRLMLEGRQFFVLTDHKPLCHALQRVSAPWSARQQRHLSYVSEFTQDIRHVPGVDNAAADALSRPPQLSCLAPADMPPFLDVDALSAAQEACPTTAALAVDPRFQVVRRLLSSGRVLMCSTSTGMDRPLLPPSFRRRAFDALHALSHPGVRGSRRLLSSRFLWPGMNKDIGTWASSCVDCQRTKVARHVRPPVQRIDVPSRRFSHVHVDLVGPLPSIGGYTHVFTVVDRSTRWPAAYPIKETSTRACIDSLVQWISGFGVPATVTSDRGSQFTSSAWSSFCKSLGIKHVMTTAYHPQSNGMVERMHRRLKAALVARRSSSSWPSELPWVLLGLRSVPLEQSAVSSAELVFGTPSTLPGQFLSSPELPPAEFLDNLHRLVDPFIPPPLVHGSSPPSGSVHLPPALWEAEYVFVRRDGIRPSLTPLYDGPYRVVHRSDTFFRLAVGDKEDSVSVSRLKPLLAQGPVVPAQPRRRGRPPRLKSPLAQTPVVPAQPRRRGRPPRLKPPAEPAVLPPAQLRRGRSAGLDPAHLGPQGLGGGHVAALRHPVI